MQVLPVGLFSYLLLTRLNRKHLQGASGCRYTAHAYMGMRLLATTPELVYSYQRVKGLDRLFTWCLHLTIILSDVNIRDCPFTSSYLLIAARNTNYRNKSCQDCCKTPLALITQLSPWPTYLLPAFHSSIETFNILEGKDLKTHQVCKIYISILEPRNCAEKT